MVVAISLGFVSARILDHSLQAFYDTKNPNLQIRHFLLDQHYPIDKDRNRAEIRRLCERHGVTVLDAGCNLGLHDGFNWALKKAVRPEDDIVIAYDCDSTPVGQGWDMALVRAIRGDREQKVVWASLGNPRTMKEIKERGYAEKKADGYLDLWVTKAPIVNSVCAWRIDWLREVGFLSEPRPWYGHLESEMYAKLGQKQWAVLPQWSESDHLRDLHDRAYVVYKWHLSHLKTTDADFETWLKTWPGEDLAPSQLP